MNQPEVAHVVYLKIHSDGSAEFYEAQTGGEGYAPPGQGLEWTSPTGRRLTLSWDGGESPGALTEPQRRLIGRLYDYVKFQELPRVVRSPELARELAVLPGAVDAVLATVMDVEAARNGDGYDLLAIREDLEGRYTVGPRARS